MIPLATYRLQLHGAFTFNDASTIAPYLRELGVSHAYCSPYLQATKGSTHGYDVVDHNSANEELGGEEGHRRFCETLGRVGLGQVLDIVPNHMAIGTRANTWWWDVLENGPSSRYASHFDVEWDPPEAKMRNLVLVPVLGDHYGRVVENGDIRLQREGGKFVFRYFDNDFPASPKSLGPLVERAAARCGSQELGFIADMLRALPSATALDPESVFRRHRDKEILAKQLLELCERDAGVAKSIEAELGDINSNPDTLDDLLSNQNYRLAFWRTAGRELGYRRFFDINTLAGLRMESGGVFRDTHSRVLEWVRNGVIDGLRVDHPDGLRDPKEYFDRLRDAAPKAWVVAEKILEPGEPLRRDWKVAGTTGYDFLFRCANLFVDPAGEEPLSSFYAEFTGETNDFEELVRTRKHQVLRGTLGSDVNRLTALFMDVCERHRRYRDFTRHDIHQSLREVIACMPVYRTYIRAEQGSIHDLDRHYIHEAIEKAKNHRQDLPTDLFDFLAMVLQLEVRGETESEFLMRFQQFTGPAMAKGVEDTSFYVYHRLSSLNEVGGNPARFGVSVEEFHDLAAQAQREWPTAMLATSTHDTKRSEDVRARLGLLSEIPQEWAQAVRSWSARADQYRRKDIPDRNIEYLLYQSIVGAWPIELDRMLNYLEKASREAKTHTSSTDPTPEYDTGLQEFVQAVYGDKELMNEMEAIASKLVEPGRITSLSQTLVKLTSPGVPDIYQGTEIWDLSLVDPDNRRPVDYERRRRLLAELDGMTPEQVLLRSDDGLPKLWVTRNALRLRRERSEAFGEQATYTPVKTRGTKASHALVYMRSENVIAVAPRLVLGLAGNWEDSVAELPKGEWVNVMTGETTEGGTVELQKLLSRFPVALLSRA